MENETDCARLTKLEVEMGRKPDKSIYKQILHDMNDYTVEYIVESHDKSHNLCTCKTSSLYCIYHVVEMMAMTETIAIVTYPSLVSTLSYMC